VPYIVKDLKYAIQILDANLSDEMGVLERYIIALRSVNLNYSQSTQLQKISLKLLISRIKKIRLGIESSFKLIEDNKTERACLKKILSLKKVKKAYGNEEINFDDYDVILAGGDSTRFHQELRNSLQRIKKENDFSVSEEWENLWEAITRTPLYSSQMGKLYNDIPKHYEVEKVYNQIEALLNKFNVKVIPKLLNYSYVSKCQQKTVFMNFFMNAIIKHYAQLLRDDLYKKTLIFVVKKSIVKRTLQQIVGSL